MVLRFGILGAADIAPTALIEPASRRDDVAVTVVAARDRARAESFAASHDIPQVVDDYAAVVAHPDVDVVFVPLPMSLHAHWSIAAMEAGKDVLCEKPFASNADEARAMVDAAGRTGRRLVEAFHWRYHPLADEITTAVRELGPLTGGTARFAVSIPDRTDLRWLWETSGGSLMDLGCYAVQWVRHAFGSQPTVLAARATAADDADPRIDATIEADLDIDGATVTISSSMVADEFEAKLVVEGRDGVLTVHNPLAPHFGHRLVLEPRDGERRSWSIEDPGTTYDHQLAAFVAHLTDGAPVPTGGGDAIETMAVIDAVYDAAGLPRRGT